MVIEPNILYFGTPVVLISTTNENGTANLAPMSSAWWLGKSCLLGLSARSKTIENLRRRPECVLNLPSANLVEAVDRLALLTGSNPVPIYKAEKGYKYEPNKFAAAKLTAVPSDLVKPPRVAECLVQLEATIENIAQLGDADSHLAKIEARIIRVHADATIVATDKPNRIDPDRWQPLIMNFCEFYGLSEKLFPSRLAKIF